VHLSPVSEEARLLEIKEVLSRAKKFSKSIIMGDLNSLSPHDSYNTENLVKILKEKNIIKYGENVLRFDVIKEIENEGYKDVRMITGQAFIPTTPTPYNKDPYHVAELRIDYAFVSNNMLGEVKKYEVIKDKKTDYASDHYPIYIELN
jgi:exodeoxyribonuclease-3